MKNSLLRHGERVIPCTDLDESHAQSKSLVGVLTKFKKHSHASKVLSSFNLIKKKYADGIEYTAVPDEVRGAVLLFGFIALAMMLYILGRIHDDLTGDLRYFSYFSTAISVILMAGNALFFLWSFRFECFRPIDEPIIFDRRNRKIYRLFRDVPSGFSGLFKPWPMRAAEYEWGLTDAWHTANLVTTGSTVTRYHQLQFVVRKSSTEPGIIDTFTVGNTLIMSERNVPVVWEHIRRFMEENGPHLQPQDELCIPQRTHSLWSSMGAVGPFGARYMTWWRQHPIVTTGALLLSPIFLPMNVAWGFCHWLSCITAFTAQWPEEVLNAIGSPSGSSPNEIHRSDTPA